MPHCPFWDLICELGPWLHFRRFVLFALHCFSQPPMHFPTILHSTNYCLSQLLTRLHYNNAPIVAFLNIVLDYIEIALLQKQTKNNISMNLNLELHRTTLAANLQDRVHQGTFLFWSITSEYSHFSSGLCGPWNWIISDDEAGFCFRWGRVFCFRRVTQE